jgi:peptidoglycan hydrolase-like protein with peptidoglycan-binding domain
MNDKETNDREDVVVAQDTDYFVWTAARKPRRHGPTRAAALMGLACVSLVGVAPRSGRVDAVDHRALGVTEPVQITQSALDPSRFEPQGVADPVLQLNHHSTAVRPSKLSQLSGEPLVLLKRGAHGEAVEKLQQRLSIGADGRFGRGTEQAVREYQKANGLIADGIAGPATLARLRRGNLPAGTSSEEEAGL